MLSRVQHKNLVKVGFGLLQLCFCHFGFILWPLHGELPFSAKLYLPNYHILMLILTHLSSLLELARNLSW